MLNRIRKSDKDKEIDKEQEQQDKEVSRDFGVIDHFPYTAIVLTFRAGAAGQGGVKRFWSH